MIICLLQLNHIQRQLLHLPEQHIIHFAQSHTVFFELLSRWDIWKVFVLLDELIYFLEWLEGVVWLEDVVGGRDGLDFYFFGENFAIDY
jgi:hypothetical protein